MKIFTDEALTKEITLETLDLGIQLAGDKKEYLFYLYNDESGVIVDLAISVSNNEINIKNYPYKLEKEEKGILLLEWDADIVKVQGLGETKIFFKYGLLVR